MVCSRNPQCIVSLHSLVADQDILHRVVKSMSHVKLTGNIRWRHYDCKWFLTSVHFCVEILIFAPLLVQFVFNLFRIVSFLQILTHSLLLKYVFPGSRFHTFFTIQGKKRHPSFSQRAIDSRYHLYYIEETPLYISSYSLTGTTPGSPTICNRCNHNCFYYTNFNNPAPKLPSASLFLSASQPMGISLCQNDLCILLFFNAFNWFINHETTKYHSHRSPVCQGF